MTYGRGLCARKKIRRDCRKRGRSLVLLVYRPDYSGLPHTKETSDAHDHPVPRVRRVEVAPLTRRTGRVRGRHAPVYALGDGDKHLTTARRHDAAHCETT